MTIRTALDPTINFSLPERVNRVREALLIKLAHRLPRSLRYRVYLDWGARTIRSNEVVPDVRFMDLADRDGS